MKTTKAFLISLFLSLSLGAQLPTVFSIRTQFYAGVNDYDTAYDLYYALEEKDVTSKPIYHGYKGMANLLMAKHSWMPWNKMTYFSTGKGYLEESIRKDPTNAELRFLRLCVQENAPFFLNYNDDIKADYNFLVSYLENLNKETIDRDLVTRIVNYLINECDNNTPEKLSIVKKMKLELLS